VSYFRLLYSFSYLYLGVILTTPEVCLTTPTEVGIVGGIHIKCEPTEEDIVSPGRFLGYLTDLKLGTLLRVRHSLADEGGQKILGSEDLGSGSQERREKKAH
jgi:hypothetical protein